VLAPLRGRAGARRALRAGAGAGAPGGLDRAWLEARDEPALRAVLAGQPEAWLVRVRKGAQPLGEPLDRALAALGYARQESLAQRGLVLERWAR